MPYTMPRVLQRHTLWDYSLHCNENKLLIEPVGTVFLASASGVLHLGSMHPPGPNPEADARNTVPTGSIKRKHRRSTFGKLGSFRHGCRIYLCVGYIFPSL